jgi:hypothetical protein
MGEWRRWDSEQEEELDVYLGKVGGRMAGLAGCQTRPIAEAHHKTHEDDVRSFGQFCGG